MACTDHETAVFRTGEPVSLTTEEIAAYPEATTLHGKPEKLGPPAMALATKLGS